LTQFLIFYRGYIGYFWDSDFGQKHSFFSGFSVQNATPSVCAKCSLKKTEYIKEYALYKRRSEKIEKSQ